MGEALKFREGRLRQQGLDSAYAHAPYALCSSADRDGGNNSRVREGDASYEGRRRASPPGVASMPLCIPIPETAIQLAQFKGDGVTAFLTQST